MVTIIMTLKLEAVENILNHFRIYLQMLSNRSNFFDVTLVWLDYKDRRANKIKRRAISSDFYFGGELLAIKESFTPAKPQSFIDYW